MRIIYITARSRGEAIKIATALVEEKLIACANINDSVTSIYAWEGEVKRDDEVSMIVKTKDSLVDEVIKRVKELHSYENPCAISIKIEKGSEDFLKWVEKSTK